MSKRRAAAASAARRHTHAPAASDHTRHTPGGYARPLITAHEPTPPQPHITAHPSDAIHQRLIHSQIGGTLMWVVVP